MYKRLAEPDSETGQRGIDGATLVAIRSCQCIYKHVTWYGCRCQVHGVILVDICVTGMPCILREMRCTILIYAPLPCRFERESLQGIPFAPGSTHVYVPAEPFLRGHYIKYNGNNGHVAIVPGKTRKANQQLHGGSREFQHEDSGLEPGGHRPCTPSTATP